MKRLFDIIVALCVISLTWPLWLVAAVAIKMGSKGPVFYMAPRMGRDGKTYTMFKFRTMHVRDENDDDARITAGGTDPRIFKAGKWIRRAKIDELPQFWNVLTGDMSIVGPRPIMVEQREMYPCTSYYALRPGITGFWQISERNETSFTDRAPFDAQYFRELSFGTDLWVMMKTFTVVVRATGY